VEVSGHHRQLAVTESSQPGAARSLAREMAEDTGFGEVDIHRVGLVITELATNLVKYGRQGELLMRASRRHGELEVISLDRGPGIRDVTRALSDGHSTGGSHGTGLGAVQRLSDDFDIYSQVDRGTVVVSRMRANRSGRQPAGALTFGVVSIAKAGEVRCGDGWQIHEEPGGASVLMADGLGHGDKAAEAADAAIARFDADPSTDLTRRLQSIHEALRPTRGAAAAIAHIDLGPQVVRYGGVGNISAAIVRNGTVRQAVSHNGTLGHEATRFREYTYPWAPDAVLVVHTDGLASQWSLDAYPGVRGRDATLIAALLYRDYSRQRDDVTVLIARQAS
jgi:anti-sigma regulatory factor (Ser/Thr protein kinase)